MGRKTDLIKTITVNSYYPRPIVLCELCMQLLSVPPVQHCESANFICGVCFSSHLYHPTKQTEVADNVTHQKLFELYAEADRFPCMYENCGATFKFGSDSFEHRKICKQRTFFCPCSRINKYYKPNYYGYCDFSTSESKDLFTHVKEKHFDLIRSGFDTEDFYRRPYGLIVLPNKDVLSVIFITKVWPHSLQISCRQYSLGESDKCVVVVTNEQQILEKCVIKCNVSIGSNTNDQEKILQDVAISNVHIEFSIVPTDSNPDENDDEIEEPHESGKEIKKKDDDEDWMILNTDS